VERTHADALRWMAAGTQLFLDAVTGLTEEEYDAASLLPGWSRRHLVAHVAANADAVGNLVRWAATGTETPMYASPEARAAGIARGETLSATELDAWVRGSAETLAAAMAALDESQWQQPVVTAQGRTVPATETPWMRAREVCVHAVDLGTGLGFGDLAPDFNAALCDDILHKRGLAVLPTEVAGEPLPEVTAWLAGRPYSLADAPALGPWL